MNEEQALHVLDEELEAALGGITAPRNFAASVRSRIREQRVTQLPEILDLIGGLAVLAVAFILLLCFAPEPSNPYWIVVLASAVLLPAFWFALLRIDG